MGGSFIFGFSVDQLWPFTNIVLLAWVALIFFPTHRYTKSGVFIVVASICAIYATCFITKVRQGFPNFSSKDSVVSLFKDPEWVFIGWIHYLAFDLLIGLYVAIDAITSRIHRIIAGICLVITLWAGPMGLGLYLIIRFIFSRGKKIV